MEEKTEGVIGFHLSYHLLPSGLSVFILPLRPGISPTESMHTRGDIHIRASFLCSFC